MLKYTVNRIEEDLIALMLGAMTLITFVNVVARYVFNSNILWGLEVTVFLFAWLVLLGVSYGVKHSLHLGVDIVTSMVSPRVRKIFALIAVTACLVFSLLLLKGCWDYWYPFVTKRAFLETDDVPMPDVLQFFSTWLNEGERYEKMPRFIPYFVLPLSLALVTYRYIQVAVKIVKGETTSLIASHGVDNSPVIESKEG
ncbi:MAG: TRAP transporter small permease [Acidiferrobacterales bacterium]|nr:TRAP transporter small permease [Acidiferrobacterales bacterium]